MQLAHAHLTRQLDLIPLENLGVPVHIIGCGAIGSFLALQLAKMGVENLTVYDMDTVSVENMSCQFFRYKDIGKNKATALRELVHDFTGVDIKATPQAWTAQDRMQGIVVAAVDSMKVRRDIFERCKDLFNVTALIDPRMGAEVALLYVMDPRLDYDRIAYQTTLYTDESAVQERCTAKSTVYTANLLSGLCTKAIKNIICKQAYPRVTQWGIAANEMQSFTGEAMRA